LERVDLPEEEAGTVAWVTPEKAIPKRRR